MASNDIEITDIGERNINLPASICFSSDTPLSQRALNALSASSIYYALFEIHEHGLLKPLVVKPAHRFPESLNQILKYTGKTNEQFTRLMVNLALSACKTGSEHITLIDPMCGKGTTLLEGLIRGFHVVGVEINEKWTQELQAYLINYLKKGRYKHTRNKERRTHNGKRLSEGFSIETAASKDDFNKGNTQTIKVFPADTRQTQLLAKKNACDILVSDLPYGVQHGSKQTKNTKMERSPLELLKDAAPAWKQVLKTKGALVISFNEFTLKWREAADALKTAGFHVLEEESYVGYLHRVDQSINRNLIVAVK